MYEAFFQLKHRPFTAAARIDRYFPAQAIEAARQALARCIERAEGAGMLVGPSGTGKTLVCHLLAEQFRQHFAVALLSNGRLTTRRELLQAILFELGLPYRRMEEGELRLSLIDYLSSDQPGNQGLLLLLDEAHTFPIRLLEEVRLITNLVRHGQPRVRLVLSGSPVLEERFASPRLEAFAQRIASRSYLEPFDHAQTRQYVISQIAAVGGDAERIFTSDALDAIYRATDGIPRLINQVCDHALILALAGGRRQLSAAGIEEAWADLQQLPTPWNGASRGENREPQRDGIIEFGGLDAEDEESEAEAAAGSHLDEPGRPTVLLHRIQDHIASLEEDFRPAGAIRPERDAARTAARAVEASAHQRTAAADPFAEEFEEEEVLVDRYACFDLGILERRAWVSCEEGSTLGALLEPCLQSFTPELSLVMGTDAGDILHQDDSEFDAVADAETFEAHSINAASNAATVFSTVASYSSDEALTREVFERASELEALALQRDGRREEGLEQADCRAPATRAETVEAAFATQDPDLMIVEEDPPAERVIAAPHVAQARKLEYRQLFSTLRQG
ncbi:MAG TPA: AAA family ATPase [Pirellulales bacterium]|nr:AAA family ATPase [Pirellulales bacterium]